MVTLMEKNTNQTRVPLVETKFSLSKDRKWFITKTIITDIRSTKYVEKVLEPKEETPSSEQVKEA